MHAALLIFHRWTALITSIVIFVVAATGSALVFEGAIDRGLNPQFWRVAQGTPPLSLDTLAARAQVVTPALPITGFTLSLVPDRAYVAQTAGVQTFVDPYTGRVLGTRALKDFNMSLPRRLHSLHTTLLAKGFGGTVVVLVTIASFLLTLTGIILWWTDKLWRIRWSASWKRIMFDLHHSLGVIASLALFIITASGIIMHYEVAAKAIAKLDSTPRAEPPSQPPANGVTTTISFDSLARVARAALPGADITFFSAQLKATQPYIVAMRFPEDHTPGGRSRVSVDRFRGTVLAVESSREAQMGTTINNQMRSIHTGDVLGKPTEAVWFLAALVLVAQSITGFLMWWNGRAGRAALARAAKGSRSSA
ncbi:MAG: PepSY-associated TM helix domain-containing protein [bacterium]